MPRDSAPDFQGGTLIHPTPLGWITIGLILALAAYVVWRKVRRR
jgi:hypothetical protein